MLHRRWFAFRLGATLALGLSLALPVTSAASDQQVLELRDDCDPATF